MREKKISIIIATYNASQTLKRCIDSIMVQKSNDIELLVIDAKSTDGTIDIIKSYKKNIDYFISETDEGVYDAWNKGIKQARGEWIMYLGADDILLPNAITGYKNYLNNNKNQLDIISAKLDYVDKFGKHIRFVGEPWDWEKMRLRKWSFAHPGLLHNYKLFEDYGFFDTNFKICGDSEFFLRIGPFIKAGFIDKVIVTMQQGGISFSYKALEEGFRIRVKNNSMPYLQNLAIHCVRVVRFYLSKLKQFILRILFIRNS